MLKILVDGDGCPVVEETIAIGEEFNIEVILVTDTSHNLYYEGIQTIVADKGKDRTDFVLLQNVKKNDIVVTQDYGLAALVLCHQAYPVSQNGFLYTNENIDELLAKRHMGSVMRKHKQRGPTLKKRTREDDEKFMHMLRSLFMHLLEE